MSKKPRRKRAPNPAHKFVPKMQVRKVATALNKIRRQTDLSIYSMAYDIEISSCTLWKVFNSFSATVQTIEKINKYLEWAK